MPYQNKSRLLFDGQSDETVNQTKFFVATTPKSLVNRLTALPSPVRLGIHNIGNGVPSMTFRRWRRVLPRSATPGPHLGEFVEGDVLPTPSP